MAMVFDHCLVVVVEGGPVTVLFNQLSGELEHLSLINLEVC